jgi:predicted GNAT family N-acyltransferase
VVEHLLEFIEYDSEQYHQAALLRYQLFYAEHHIPFDAIFDPQEPQDLHLAAIEPITKQLLAYGRLSQNNPTKFKIYQMVVEPAYQGQGLGSIVLQGLMQAAIQAVAQASINEGGGHLVVLNARVAKVGFYQKQGFVVTGEIVKSLLTGELHYPMEKRIS